MEQGFQFSPTSFLCAKLNKSWTCLCPDETDFHVFISGEDLLFDEVGYLFVSCLGEFASSDIFELLFVVSAKV